MKTDPVMATSVRIVQHGLTLRIEIDGEAFPWFTGGDLPVVTPVRNGVSMLTLSIPVDGEVTFAREPGPNPPDLSRLTRAQRAHDAKKPIT